MIESVDNQKVKLLAKLKIAKYRHQEQLFVVEGKHLVEEARNSGLLQEAFSIEDKVGYTLVSTAVMKKICSTDTVVSEIGLCKMVLHQDLTDKLLILDKVQDPGNMGALMRSAAAFGFRTIVLGQGCVDIYNDKVIRSSQGAIFKLNFLEVDLLQFLPKLINYSVYGTNVVNGISLEEVTKKDKLAIVLGNEGNGISKEVNSCIRKNIYIPINNMESLNVSVAGGIIMYYFR